MVRIHVVRASQLLIWAVIALLVVALVWIVADRLLGANEDAVSVQSADYVRMEADFTVEAETEAVAASASAVFAPEDFLSMRAEVVRAGSLARVPAVLPRVCIYHTHTHEAYCQDEENAYVETSAWRTLDNNHNIVRVGEALAEALAERGFSVIHDQTDHELNALSTAYTRSLDTMLSRAQNTDIFIDVHRDAYNANSSGKPFSVLVNGVDTARLMFLVGNGAGFEEKPYYAQNFDAATRLTGAVNALAPGLCRPVMVKDGRYNQHVSENALLVEVGHNRNSLAQALAAVPYLADALYAVYAPETGQMTWNKP